MEIPCSKGSRGFTLIELLVVLWIIAALAALLFPVFAQARSRARQAVCSSNLRQLGLAVFVYSVDNDEDLPYGVDYDDKYTESWRYANGGAFWPQIKQFPLLPQVMQPYVKNDQLWQCPSDTGFDDGDILLFGLRPKSSCYASYGMSYFYNTSLALNQKSLSSLTVYDPKFPYLEHGTAEIRLLSDPVGNWHGGLNYYDASYNYLMCDGHVARLSEVTKQKTDNYALDRP